MKRSLFLIVTGIFALSCGGDPETLLVRHLEVTPIVNPEVGILIEKSSLDVTLIDEKTILGIGSGRIFETSDKFSSFQVSSPYEKEVLDIAYMASDAIVCYELPYNHFYDPITFYSTRNKGASWKKTGIQDDAFTRVLRIQLINENEGFLLLNNLSSPSNTLIYKLDLDKSDAAVVGKIVGYEPKEMKFLDASHGYVLLRSDLNGYTDHNTYVSRTMDGGTTWSTPTLVDDDRVITKLEIIDQNTLIVFVGGPTYRSDDGGTNWDKIEISDDTQDISFVSRSTGFSIGYYGAVSKSTDGGLSWSSLGEIKGPGYGGSYLHIHFYNENVGIVYGESQLYLTEDGGRSWQILVFPFRYVTG